MSKKTEKVIRKEQAEDRDVGKLLAGHKGRVELGPEYPGYVIEDNALCVTGAHAVDLIRTCAEDSRQNLVEFVKDAIARGYAPA